MASDTDGWSPSKSVAAGDVQGQVKKLSWRSPVRVRTTAAAARAQTSLQDSSSAAQVGPGVKPQLKTAARRQEGRPVLLCFFTAALISGGWLALDTASYAPEGDLPRVLARRFHFSIPV